MGFKKDDSGRVPKSSFSSSLVFTPCPLFGVQFKKLCFKLLRASSMLRRGWDDVETYLSKN